MGSLLAALLLVVGCSGIEPYEPHDYRREGPKQDLFSGPTGEFVIYEKKEEPQTGSEIDSKSDEPEDGEQQKTDEEEKRNDTKSGEQ